MMIHHSFIIDEGTRVPIRRIMDLGVLPSLIITHVFNDIKRRYTPIPNDRIVDLFTYFETKWIRKVPPYEWSMHRVKTRTNNAAEGFHNRLNIRVMKGNIKILNC